jgi:hypothetical protein
MSASEMFVIVDGKPISSSQYRKQRLLEILSPDAKRLLNWIKSRRKQRISTVEMVKCITPIHFRRVSKIRELMNELVRLEFALKAGPMIHEGRIRKESWEFKT